MATKRRKGSKTKSRRQVAFLLSSGSPLTKAEKAMLRRELKTGQVRIKRGR